MRERPIIFNADMVRTVLESSKTQTRRIAPISQLKIEPYERDMVTWNVQFSKPIKGVTGSYSGGRISESEARQVIASQFCPLGQRGDRLWVRETFSVVPRTAYAASDGVQQVICPDDSHEAAIFRAGWEHSTGGIRWRPSIHMPRWASRITLEITGVRVERLQDISEADCAAEGLGSPFLRDYKKPKFAALWQSIYGEESWQANPWVWVIEFKRVEGE